jgi:hypothetical protein
MNIEYAETLPRLSEYVLIGITSNGKRFIYSHGSKSQCEYGLSSYKKTFGFEGEVMTSKAARKIFKPKKIQRVNKEVYPSNVSC